MLKKILLIIVHIFISIGLSAQPYQLISWNLYNFGKSKTTEEIEFIANILRDADIIAIQEVSSSSYGPKAVAILADILNRKGAKWDYAISDPTNGKGSERYAYLWKTSKFTIIKNAYLETRLDTQIEREPFLIKLKDKKSKNFFLANIHAVPKSKEPWRELKYLYLLQNWYEPENLIIMGDFNLDHNNQVFKKLKNMGFEAALANQKTTIKMEPKQGQHLANSYDNFFYEKSSIQIFKAGVIDFTSKFSTLKEARTISDHLPIFIEFE
jgi:endonuclease/exonuclease/phosphatase family metal-dependent hydrolase